MTSGRIQTYIRRAMWTTLVFAALSATPLYATEGPSVVQSIERREGRLAVSLDPRFDGSDVAEQIRASLPQAQVLVVGDTLFVEGVDEATLRSRLQGRSLESTPDDVDALLAALRTDGPQADGSGSSVRAGREDMEAPPPEPKRSLVAQVKGLDRHRFPLVLIEVSLSELPEGSDFEPGQVITVLPRVKSHRGLVDPDDPISKLNVGAWYAKPGDRVRLILESRPEGQKVWVAERFERIK